MRGVAKVLLTLSAGTSYIAECGDMFGILIGVLLDGGGVDGSVDGEPGDVAADVPFDGGYINPDATLADCGMGAPMLMPEGGLFVNPAANPSNTACTFTSPCTTISAAMAVATFGNVVYLAPGTYTETLDLSAAGVTIEGGWQVTDAGWVPQCNDTSAIIQRNPASSSEYAVSVSAASFTFRLVKILNNVPPTAAPGTSVYAILCYNTALTLDNVTIEVGPGVDGISAVDGTGQDPPACGPPSDGASGGPGVAGAGALPGGPGAMGFSASSDAQNGFIGNDGHTGTAGADAGACLNCVTQCTVGCGLGDGGPDSGMATCTSMPTTPSCPGPGTGGCGGGGGFGGWGAGRNPVGNPGGGSSVALYLWGGSVTFVNVVALKSDTAGAGGAGGVGNGGAAGASGSTGTPASCITSATCANVSSDSCGMAAAVECGMSSSFGTGMTPGGAAGGMGGAGGTGGHGGGGSGGNSYAYYTGNSAQVLGTTVPATQFGMAGAGGDAGGVMGQAGAHN